MLENKAEETADLKSLSNEKDIELMNYGKE